MFGLVSKHRWKLFKTRIFVRFLLANKFHNYNQDYRSMNEFKFRFLCVCMICFTSLLSAEIDDRAESGDRIAILEARLAELEDRLNEAEESKKGDSLHAEDRITELELRLADAEKRAESAERLAVESTSKKRKAVSDRIRSHSNQEPIWKREERWDEIKPGVSMETVVKLLGQPRRSLDSLKPRVGKVFYYQSSLQVSADSLRGKISFRDDKVLTVKKPDFGQFSSDLNESSQSF